MLEISVIRRMAGYLPDTGRALQRKILDILPHRGLHKAAGLVDIMHRVSLEIYRQKKRAFEEGDEAVMKQIGEGKDIMSLLSMFCCTVLAVCGQILMIILSECEHGRVRGGQDARR